MYHKPLTRGILLGIFVSGLLLHCQPSLAKTLVLEAQASGKAMADQLMVILKVRNQGHESMYNLEAVFRVFGKQEKISLRSHLSAHTSFDFHYKKKISNHPKGLYPFTGIIDFQDINNQKFSAVFYGTFFIEENVHAALACSVDDLIMEGQGKLIFHLKNLGPDLKNVKATLVLPRELSADRRNRNLEMPPWGEEKVEFEIINPSSSPEGSYPVGCFFEYDSKHTHYTALSKTSIKVVKKGSRYIRGLRLACLIMGIVFGVAFLGYRFKTNYFKR